MKQLTLIAAICVAVCLFSCRTQKTVTNIDRDGSLSYVDTTKTVADTTGRKQTTTDTTTTVVACEDVGIVEFVEGGGKVRIDSAGNVTLEGVKNIKSHHKGSIAQNKGVTQKAEETAGHREQLNGVKADQTRHEKRTEGKAPSQKWYETAFVRIGQVVCISVLLWILFIYLRRRM